MYNGIVISEVQAIYYYIPKCACTSLKKLIADFQGIQYANIHTAPFSKIPPNEWWKYKSWTHFAIVRNPFDRLYSLYRDKLRPGTTAPGFVDGVDHAVFGGTGVHASMTFEEFALYVTTIQDPDPHYAPQSRLLPQSDGVLEIIRFEDLDERLPRLLKQIYINLEVPHLNRSPRPVNGYRKAYSDTLRKVVENYYQEDLNRFYYAF